MILRIGRIISTHIFPPKKAFHAAEQLRQEYELAAKEAEARAESLRNEVPLSLSSLSLSLSIKEVN